MKAKAIRLVKWIAALSAASLVTVLAVRAWDAQRGDPLELWHTFVPHELTAKEIDQADWQKYLVAEQRLFDEVRANVTDKLPEAARDEANRYYAGAPIYPGKFATDWNRSYVMRPAERRPARS